MYNYAYLHTDGKFFIGIVWLTIYKCKTEREKFFALQLLDSWDQFDSIDAYCTRFNSITILQESRGSRIGIKVGAPSQAISYSYINYNDDIQWQCIGVVVVCGVSCAKKSYALLLWWTYFPIILSKWYKNGYTIHYYFIQRGDTRRCEPSTPHDQV